MNAQRFEVIEVFQLTTVGVTWAACHSLHKEIISEFFGEGNNARNSGFFIIGTDGPYKRYLLFCFKLHQDSRFLKIGSTLCDVFFDVFLDHQANTETVVNLTCVYPLLINQQIRQTKGASEKQIIVLEKERGEIPKKKLKSLSAAITVFLQFVNFFEGKTHTYGISARRILLFFLENLQSGAKEYPYIVVFETEKGEEAVFHKIETLGIKENDLEDEFSIY